MRLFGLETSSNKPQTLSNKPQNSCHRTFKLEDGQRCVYNLVFRFAVGYVSNLCDSLLVNFHSIKFGRLVVERTKKTHAKT